MMNKIYKGIALVSDSIICALNEAIKSKVPWMSMTITSQTEGYEVKCLNEHLVCSNKHCAVGSEWVQ